MTNPNYNQDELVEMIKELNLEPDRQVELIQRLVEEGLTESLKKELLEEVSFAETNLAQEEAILARAEEATQHPERIPQMLEEVYQRYDQQLSQLEAEAEELLPEDVKRARATPQS